MKQLAEVHAELGYTVYTDTDESVLVLNGYTSDLLSDVMGNAAEDSALITIQAHKNTVAVASLIGIKAIILCNGRTPTDDMLASANEEQIAILGTTDNQFTASYRLAKVLGIVS
jgi:hypothetical protein